jgi:hypothetical protein
MKRILILLTLFISLSASAQFKNVQIPQNDYPVNGNIIQRVNNQWRTRTLAQLRVDLNIADSSYILEALESYVPTSRTITINGDTFDLSENREWTVTAALDTASLSDRINLKQNADADLTTYASITPTTVAQSLLAFANPSAIRFLRVNADNTVSGRTAAEVLSDIGAAASGHDHSGVYQAADADLTTYAGITPTTIGQAILNFASPSAVRYFKINADNTITGRTAAEMLSDLGAASSAHDHSALYQPLDANLTTYASIAPSTVAQGILSLANPSAVRYLKINADNSVSFRTAAEMLGDVGGAALAGGNTISGDQTFSDQLFATALTRDATLTDSATVADPTTGELVMRKIDITVTKADVGLGNVDDYSAAQLATLTQTFTGKTIDGDDNTLQDIPASAIKTSESETLDITTLATLDDLNERTPRQIRALNALGFSIKMETLGVEWGTINTATAHTDGRLHMHFLGVPDMDMTVTHVTFYQSTPGVYTADNENRIGLYSYNAATGDFTLVASTANDGNLWKAATGFVNTAFSASANLTAGTPYFIGALYNNSAQTTAPSLMGGASNGTSTVAIGTASVRLSSGVNTQTTLTSSINASSLAGISTRPWFKVY